MEICANNTYQKANKSEHACCPKFQKIPKTQSVIQFWTECLFGCFFLDLNPPADKVNTPVI